MFGFACLVTGFTGQQVGCTFRMPETVRRADRHPGHGLSSHSRKFPGVYI